MQEHGKKIMQYVREQGEKVRGFFYNKKVTHAGNIGLRAALFGIIAWGGWGTARIATGMQDGVAPDFVPQTLPLLLSGVLYVDRFAAVVVTLLALALLLELTRQNARSIKSILGTGILVLGVLTAATPLTLVAWLFLVLLVHVRNVAKKEQGLVLTSMGALMLSVLLLSGGAFLAEMTIVATIAAELARPTVLLALALLFGGSLASVRWLTGAYVLVPVYITLRLCLFFLGAAPAMLVTVIALGAAVLAWRSARAQSAYAVYRAHLFAFFMAIPLTMIAVNVQNIAAVQAFLFGGIALAASAVIGYGAYEKKESDVHPLELLFRTPLPGTFSGMGFLLLVCGLAVLGEQATSFAEQVFLGIVAGVTVYTWGALMMRMAKRSSEHVSLPAPFQAMRIALLALLAGSFAHILAYLGTTIGGEIPDSKIEIAFTSTVLTITPWMLLLLSAVLFVGVKIFSEKKPELWERGVKKLEASYTYVDNRWMKGEEKVSAMCVHWAKQCKETRERVYRNVKDTESQFAHKTGVFVAVAFIGSVIILLSL